MVFPLIPLVLVAGTIASVGLQAKDSFFPEKQITTVSVKRQTRESNNSNFSTFQIGGISIPVIVAIIFCILALVVFIK